MAGINNKVNGKITLTAVFVFLGFLFLIFASFLVYLRYSSFSPLADYFQKKSTGNTSIENIFSSQMANKEIKTVEIKITESELNEALLSGVDLPLKDPEAKVTPEGILINGKTKNLILPVKVEVLVSGEAKNGRIVFDITSIKAAGVVAPDKIAQPLTNSLSQKLLLLLPVQKDINFTDINFFVGFLTIEGERKS